MLDDLTLTTTIKFCACSSILEETRLKCAFFAFDENILDSFLTRFRVIIIDRDEVGSRILNIQTKLLAYPFAAGSAHATKDEPDVDLCGSTISTPNFCLCPITSKSRLQPTSFLLLTYIGIST